MDSGFWFGSGQFKKGVDGWDSHALDGHPPAAGVRYSASGSFGGGSATESPSQRHHEAGTNTDGRLRAL